MASTTALSRWSHQRALFRVFAPLLLSVCLSLLFPPLSYGPSGGIFLALLHSFLLHRRAAAVAVSSRLPLSARNLAPLATPPPAHTPHGGPKRHVRVGASVD